MKLPELDDASRYAGLYVFDFDGQVAVGYTADEVAVLLESERYRDGKVYRIHRASPDGTMELQGVPRERFEMEDGLFFYRATLDAAKADLESLTTASQSTPPPCRAKVVLATLDGELARHVLALIFPAEQTHDIAGWLEAIHFNGGDLVEGGPSQVTRFYEAGKHERERRQFWPAQSESRSSAEVLASVGKAVQRIPA